MYVYNSGTERQISTYNNDTDVNMDRMRIQEQGELREMGKKNYSSYFLLPFFSTFNNNALFI